MEHNQRNIIPVYQKIPKINEHHTLRTPTQQRMTTTQHLEIRMLRQNHLNTHRNLRKCLESYELTSRMHVGQDTNKLGLRKKETKWYQIVYQSLLKLVRITPNTHPQ